MGSEYVWFQGRCWRLEPWIRDYRGHVLLVDLRDSSRGVLADPECLRECLPEVCEAIEYFLKRER